MNAVSMSVQAQRHRPWVVVMPTSDRKEQKIRDLMELGMSRERAQEAAAIELGESDGDVIDIDASVPEERSHHDHSGN